MDFYKDYELPDDFQTAEGATYETLDELVQMLKEQSEQSKRESQLAEHRHKIQTRQFIVSVIIGVLTLLSSVFVPILVAAYL